jgi:hypothetical protein
MVLTEVASVLEPQGYTLSKYVPGCFERRGVDLSNRIQLELKTGSSLHGFSGQLLTFNRVEAIIMEIEFPNFDLTMHKKGQVLLTTVQDKAALSEYKNDQLIETDEEWHRWVNSIKTYLKNDGVTFSEKYEDLQAVLKKIDELHSEGKRWRELLGGGPEYYFRGLIISKLLNDPGYEQKVEHGDNVFIKNVTPAWQPYYKKLKAKLNSIT